MKALIVLAFIPFVAQAQPVNQWPWVLPNPQQQNVIVTQPEPRNNLQILQDMRLKNEVIRRLQIENNQLQGGFGLYHGVVPQPQAPVAEPNLFGRAPVPFGAVR